MNKILIVMAAGIGSRYGVGVKQLAKMIPNGETIIDFSVYDAIEAGFNKVVFVIRKEIEKDFKELIGDRISQFVEVDYAFQELEDVPEGIIVPKERKKPWGTVHALLSARDLIDGPFLVINADDYYGKEAFHLMSKFLDDNYRRQSDKYEMAMCAYKLSNTLSLNGSVTRGICKVSEEGYLLDIQETKGIRAKAGSIFTEDDKPLRGDSIVSMNTWAGYPDLIRYMEKDFKDYLKDNREQLATLEYVLPTMVEKMLEEDRATIKTLFTNDKWIGITYKQDLEPAREEFRKMLDKGLYKDKLWPDKNIEK